MVKLSWKILNSVASVRERTIPTERPRSVWQIPYGRILGFLNRSRYFFLQVAPQLYPWGWVNPVPDPLLLRNSGSAGNGTRTSGSVARNSDHYHRGGLKITRILEQIGNIPNFSISLCFSPKAITISSAVSKPAVRSLIFTVGEFGTMTGLGNSIWPSSQIMEAGFSGAWRELTFDDNGF
jgi:hypothetical protein